MFTGTRVGKERILEVVCRDFSSTPNNRPKKESGGSQEQARGRA